MPIQSSSTLAHNETEPIHLLPTPTNDSGPKPAKMTEAHTDQDQWLGILSNPLHTIPNTAFALSRLDHAVPSSIKEPRVNAHGYDRDNPKDAIQKYTAAHPKSRFKKAWHAFTNSLFNLFTCCVPNILSASAGKTKERIDQKVVLRIVRESVDKFPELTIRVPKENWDRMDRQDQMRWREQMSIVRAAQHDYIANQLAREYPGHINQDAPTILYTGGRAVGLLRVLYCSVNEYVALYWSDWGLSSTDSGSYRAHVYDYITEGHNINWNAHYLDFKAQDYEVTEPGEYTFLGEGDRKIWSFEGPCGMVDHGIGDVISMVKFATVSNITSTLNFTEIGKLLSNQAKAVAHEYGQRLKESLGFTDVEVKPVSRVSDEEFTRARAYFSPILEHAKGVAAGQEV